MVVVVVVLVVVVVGGAVTVNEAGARSVNSSLHGVPVKPLHAHTVADPAGWAGTVNEPLRKPLPSIVHKPTWDEKSGGGSGPVVKCTVQVNPGEKPDPLTVTVVPAWPRSGDNDMAGAATRDPVATNNAVTVTRPATVTLTACARLDIGPPPGTEHQPAGGPTPMTGSKDSTAPESVGGAGYGNAAAPAEA